MLTCRLATSNAWQEQDQDSGLASAKHAAASVPLDGLKVAFRVSNRPALHALSGFPMRTLQGWLSRNPSCLHAAPLKA